VVLKLLVQLEDVEDWEDNIDTILETFEKETGRELTYTICFY
jgi:hypothetical protein